MPETIVMIHGMWGKPWVWDNYKTFFEQKGYRCVTPTLPFHDINPGDAPDPRLGTTSLLDYAEYLEKEIASLDTKPIIMGHSMGGLLAQILGSRGLPKALVLLTPAAPAGIRYIPPWTVIRTFLRIMAIPGFWSRSMMLSFGATRYSVLNLISPEERREIYSKFVPESGRTAAEIAFWMLDKRGAARVDTLKVTCPVLVVGGSLDKITPVVTTKLIAAKYPGLSTYKEYPDHSHWVLEEPGWQQIAEDVEAWLKSALH